MHIVEWDDYEGVRQEMAFETIEEAKTEVEALREKYDYVNIVSE